MAEEPRSNFTEKATKKLSSPDDLDKYVQVTNPSVWMALFACIALVGGLLAWGVFGSVTTSVSTTGVAADGKVVCFLPASEIAKVDAGDAAYVDSAQMTVAKVSSYPLSREEVGKLINSDYLS